MIRVPRRPFSLSLVAVALLGALSGCDETTAPPRVTGIILTPVSETLSIGGVLQLGANVLGSSGSTLSNYPVEWSSSETSVATVSSAGIVNALTVGTTTITATAGDISRDAQILVRPPNCTTPGGGALTVGGAQSGNMAQSSCLLYNAFTAVGYSMTLPAAAGVKFNLTSSGHSPGLSR